MTMLDLLRSLATTGGRWWRSRLDRHRLVSLSDHTLRDLGLTRSDVEGVYAQSFWQGIDYAELEARRRRSAPRWSGLTSVNQSASSCR